MAARPADPRGVLRTAPVDGLRGVLRTAPDGGFDLRRHAPPPMLAAVVDVVWIVRWDRRGLPPYTQATLPHPAVHLTVEDGAAWLYSPPRWRFERALRGRSRVVGVRFRFGAVRPLLARLPAVTERPAPSGAALPGSDTGPAADRPPQLAPVSMLTDRRLPAGVAVPGLDADALVTAVTAAGDDADQAVRAIADALTPLLPPTPDPTAGLAERAVTALEADPTLHTAADLAAHLGLSVRSLHRLFAEYVGVGPGWVARRFRLQEAAVHATTGAPVDWARLATDLGYCDQAHLVRDFTRTIGAPPARYAATIEP